MLTEKQRQNVCLCFQGAKQCRYLAESETTYNVWVCAKKTPSKQIIDKQIQKYKDDGGDPRKDGLPIGDNCTGYLKLESVEQGYDVD